MFYKAKTLPVIKKMPGKKEGTEKVPLIKLIH
jgi:hypothetical protein